MKKAIVTTLLVAGLATAQADIITQWTFDDDTTDPSIGTGTASLVGGTTATFAAGATGNPDRGWNTSTYPAQSTDPGTAGVAFFVSTADHQDITLSFDHRASGTASRWAQLDYTIDGGTNWVTGFWNNGGGLSPHDTFYPFAVDFTSVTGANDNPDFGFRIVSIFSPVAFDDALGNDFGAGEAYHRARASGGGVYGPGGTWRFDNVTIEGTLIPEPSTFALLGLASAALVIFRRRQ